MTTFKQEAVLGFVEGFIASRKASPSLKEIAGALGMAESTVHVHVTMLIKAGKLTRAKGRHRGLGLAKPEVCPSCGAKISR